MSELHELRPDRPASVVLTAEDVRRYIAAKHANLPCQACGAESFTMCPERDGAAGEARGLVWLACDACNSLRTFLRPPIMAWLRGARGG
jgi:hypothetical protein